MQTMPPSASDTHDHGPPTTTQALANSAKETVRSPSPFPRLAVWSTKLSSAEINGFSGAMAGVASGIVTCPLDVIKTKLQAQGSFTTPTRGHDGPGASKLYRGLIGTGRTIVRQDGLKGMYRGLGPMLLGYLPTWAVYMAVYDAGKGYLSEHNFLGSADSELLGRGYASMCAGACSTVVTNPIWVVKTRLMSQVGRSASDGARTPWQYDNTLDAFKKMYRSEGLRAFYSGLAPALLGLTHVAIQFPLYEYFKERFTGVRMGEAPGSGSQADHAQNTFGILAATFLSKIVATSATYPHEVLRTRLQTQQRHMHPESAHDGVSGSHHSQSIHAKPVGNTDGGIYRPRYSGVINSMKIIFREEGLRAFYNGMGTNMIRAVPAAMTTMLTFESIKSSIGKLQEQGRAVSGE